VDTPSVETSSELTVSDDRTTDDAIIEDPINDENAPDVIRNDDITPLETYSNSILLEVTLKR
jgi:hypothetical protein